MYFNFLFQFSYLSSNIFLLSYGVCGYSFAPSKPISKLNCFEREGLQWLKNAVKCRKIAVTQADKGGCILIVDPELIITSTLEKLNDACRYKF